MQTTMQTTMQATKTAPTHQTSDAYKAIEKALREAAVAQKSVAYGYLLRRLPDWVLEGICHVADGDRPGAATLAYLTMRLGWLLHGHKNRVYDPKNEEIARVSERVLRGGARELLRRRGVLECFEPSPDPFAVEVVGPREIALSAHAKAAVGPERELLDGLLTG